MGEIPHEKALVERFGSQGFAILGVNTDADKDDFLNKKEEYGVTWRNLFNGSPDGGVPSKASAFPQQRAVPSPSRKQLVSPPAATAIKVPSGMESCPYSSSRVSYSRTQAIR